MIKPAEPESPKFDLAASNFPPLPGAVVSVQGEPAMEMRLSDVVRGMKATNKVEILPTLLTCTPPASQVHVLIEDCGPLQPAKSKEANKAEHVNPCDAPEGKPDPVTPAACSAHVPSLQSR